ncbi:MAG: hypothetical protein J4A00_05595 [Gammaproteobacteria bacterium]|nr:hypothetical protein [Gammaproteobacteria bacterium]
MSEINNRFAAALDEDRQTLWMKLQGPARVRIVASPINGGNTVLRSATINADSDYRGKLVLSDLLPGNRQYRYEIRIDPLFDADQRSPVSNTLEQGSHSLHNRSP